METIALFLNTPWGIFLGRILFVSIACLGITKLIVMGGDLWGFFSTPKKKQFYHMVAEFIAGFFSILISYIIFKLNIFMLESLKISDVNAAAGYSIIYGSIAIGLQFLFSNNRIGKFYKSFKKGRG